MIREAGGLELLVEAAQDSTNRANKPLLAAATGALWKCASSDISVKKLDQLGAVATLVRLLDDENDGVLTNVAGALAECAKYPPNRDKIRSAGGIPMLSKLLYFTQIRFTKMKVVSRRNAFSSSPSKQHIQAIT